MFITRKILLPTLAILLVACSNGPKPADENDLTTVRNGVVLRDTSGLEGKNLKELPANTPLKDLGLVSDRLTHLEYQETVMDEPWIKVAGPDQIEGWVFSGDIAPIGADSLAVIQFRQDKKLRSLLGAGLLDSLQDFNRAFELISDAAAFASTYRQGDSLRLKISENLGEKLTAFPVPDMTFVRDKIRGFQPLLVAEGTAWYLFNDYAQWEAVAQKTPQSEDDAFVRLMIACFPEDSIEYFYPAWFLQTWDYGGESLLGQGLHLRILAGADSLYSATPLFHPELVDLKNRILNDITNVNVSYWEDAPKIREELESLLARKWSILSPAEIGMIRIRRTQFDDPGRNGISYNTRSGME